MRFYTVILYCWRLPAFFHLQNLIPRKIVLNFFASTSSRRKFSCQGVVCRCTCFPPFCTASSSFVGIYCVRLGISLSTWFCWIKWKISLTLYEHLFRILEICKLHTHLSPEKVPLQTLVDRSILPSIYCPPEHLRTQRHIVNKNPFKGNLGVKKRERKLGYLGIKW